MRKLLGSLASALLLFGLAGSASALTLNFEGTSTLLLGDFPPAPLTGGGVATINGSGGSVGGHVDSLRLAQSRGQIGGSFSLLVTDPVSGPANSIALIQLLGITGETGTFGNISGALQNTATGIGPNQLGIGGLVKLCLVDVSCTQFLELPLEQNGAQVGVGGQLFVGNNFIRISIEAAPWTIKTGVMLDHITTVNKANQTTVTFTLKGFAHGPNSTTTSTAQPSGVIQLVTPTQVTTNLPFGSNAFVASGTVVRYHFIPEPGILLLIGSSVVGLALLGRRKLRKR